MPARDRNERHYGDDDLRQMVLTQAATPVGASKVILKDRLYSYADRMRVGDIIEQLVKAGTLTQAKWANSRMNGAGKPSVRAFAHKRDADAFACGQGVPTRAVVKPKKVDGVPSDAPKFPKLHDMLDPMGSSRGPALTGLRKPGSSVRKADMPVLNRPPETEATITSATKVTVCPSGADQRYTVRALPPGYVSGLDARESRPWAAAAAGGRAA
jgi:hypothetical protein